MADDQTTGAQNQPTTPTRPTTPAQPSAEPGRRRGGVDTSVRTAAVWSTVNALVAQRSTQLGRPLHVVDLGGGTGGIAVPLAAQGHRLTVVDPSPDALASLRRRAGEESIVDQIAARQGDAESLTEVLATLDAPPVDLVCFHDTLEVVDDPAAALAGIAAALPSGGLLSLVTAQRMAAVLARAINGNLDQARAALEDPHGRWGSADPIPRRFDEATLADLVTAASFTVSQVRGIRMFTDLVPSAALDTEAARRALLELEHLAAQDPRFAPVLGPLGAALHVVATRT